MGCCPSHRSTTGFWLSYLQAGGVAVEAGEGALVAVHQREQVDGAEGVEELPGGEDQDVREQLQRSPCVRSVYVTS